MTRLLIVCLGGFLGTGARTASPGRVLRGPMGYGAGSLIHTAKIVRYRGRQTR